MATLNSDVKNMYTATTALIADNPNLAAAPTVAQIQAAGYSPSTNVTPAVAAWVDTNNYTLTASGLGAWGLTTNVATMTIAAGVATLTPAAP